MSTDLVSVDIGGTHARFAIATVDEDGTITLSKPETLHTEDHASFQTAWEDFRQRMGGSLPPRISMAIAGPGAPRQATRGSLHCEPQLRDFAFHTHSQTHTRSHIHTHTHTMEEALATNTMDDIE